MWAPSYPQGRRVQGWGRASGKAACWARPAVWSNCVVSLLGDTHGTPEGSSSWACRLIPAEAGHGTRRRLRDGEGRPGAAWAALCLTVPTWASMGQPTAPPLHSCPSRGFRALHTLQAGSEVGGRWAGWTAPNCLGQMECGPGTGGCSSPRGRCAGTREGPGNPILWRGHWSSEGRDWPQAGEGSGGEAVTPQGRPPRPKCPPLRA